MSSPPPRPVGIRTYGKGRPLATTTTTTSTSTSPLKPTKTLYSWQQTLHNLDAADDDDDDLLSSSSSSSTNPYSSNKPLDSPAKKQRALDKLREKATPGLLKNERERAVLVGGSSGYLLKPKGGPSRPVRHKGFDVYARESHVYDEQDDDDDDDDDDESDKVQEARRDSEGDYEAPSSQNNNNHRSGSGSFYGAGKPARRTGYGYKTSVLSVAMDGDEDDEDDDEDEGARTNGSVGVERVAGVRTGVGAASSSLPPLTSSSPPSTTKETHPRSPRLSSNQLLDPDGDLPMTIGVEAETYPIRQAGHRRPFPLATRPIASSSFPPHRQVVRQVPDGAEEDEDEGYITPTRTNRPRPGTRRRRLISEDEEEEEQDPASGFHRERSRISSVGAARAGSKSKSPRGSTVIPGRTAPAVVTRLRSPESPSRIRDHDEAGSRSSLERTGGSSISGLEGGLGKGKKRDRPVVGFGSGEEEVDEVGFTDSADESGGGGGGKKNGRGKKNGIAKEPKVRPLSKKARIEMDKETARIRASKQIKLAALPRNNTGSGGMAAFLQGTGAWLQERPVKGTPRPLSDWTQTRVPNSTAPLPSTIEAVSSALGHHMHQEEEIGKFSSGGNRAARVEIDLGGTPSSPTVVRKGELKLTRLGKTERVEVDDGEDDLDADLPTNDELWRKKQLKVKEEQLRRRKAEALAKEKAMAYKDQQVIEVDDEDDDDIEIEGMPEVAKKPVEVKPRSKTGGARGIFDHARHAEGKNGGGLNAKQRYGAMAGVRTRKPQSTMTESMVVHAGKDFDHANKTNAGVVPAGLDKRKTMTIDKVRLDETLLEQHRRKNLEVRAAKEKASGFASRRMEARQPINVDEVINSGRWAEGEDENDAKSQEEDPEDGEYKPPGDDDVEMEDVGDDGDGDERSIVYSGEEDEVDPIVRGTPSPRSTSRSPGPIDGDVDDLDAVPRHRSRKTRIADSDDDETTPKAASKASFVPPSHSTLEPAASPPAEAFMQLEAGFGDDADLGGGFSQFFGATQAGGDEGDGFGGFEVLRHDDADAVLATQIDLPDPTISATARRRNEELLGDEMMLDDDSPEIEKAPVKQYLNDQGLLTQTRPVGRAPLIKSDTATSLTSAGGNDDFSFRSMELSATYRSPPEPASVDEDVMGEDEESGPRRRIKPRQAPSADDNASIPETTGPASEANVTLDSDILTGTEVASSNSSPVASRQPLVKNAYDILKAAPRRTLPKLDPFAREEYKARYVEGEAEEDEEDQGWGGGARQDDDEEDDDPNAVLEGLVDDAQKSSEELEKEEQMRVEKRRQIAAEDDERLRKIAEDATRGEFRVRKGRRVGDFGMSDEEEEGQRRMSRKRGKKVRQIGNANEGTEAFEAAYHVDLDDEDDDEPEPEDDEEPARRLVARSVSPEDELSTAQRLRQVAAENKRQSIIHLDDAASDTDESDQESQFTVIRNESQTLTKQISMSMRDPAKLERYLATDGQRTTDTRKIGGTSAVSGGNNRKAAPQGAFGRPANTKKSHTQIPARTESRSLSSVITKRKGFD